MPAKSRKTTKKPAKTTKPATAAAPVVALVPGTVPRKLDRAGTVRCECTVEAGGYKYDGKVYGSLSGAAARLRRSCSSPARASTATSFGA